MPYVNTSAGVLWSFLSSSALCASAIMGNVAPMRAAHSTDRFMIFLPRLRLALLLYVRRTGGAPDRRDYSASVGRCGSKTGSAPSYAWTPWDRCRLQAGPSEPSTVHVGADIGPDRVDLLGIEHATPWRHRVLAIEHRVHETSVVARAQPSKVETCTTTRVAQPFAVTGPAVIPIDALALCHLLHVGRRLRHGRSGDKCRAQDNSVRSNEPRSHEWCPRFG